MWVHNLYIYCVDTHVIGYRELLLDCGSWLGKSEVWRAGSQGGKTTSKARLEPTGTGQSFCPQAVRVVTAGGDCAYWKKLLSIKEILSFWGNTQSLRLRIFETYQITQEHEFSLRAWSALTACSEVCAWRPGTVTYPRPSQKRGPEFTWVNSSE